VTAAWTGRGPIGRGVINEHFKSDGFSVTEHFNGTDRTATATGTVAGVTLSTSGLAFAHLSTTKSATVTVCKGNGC
jgi:hypothetical protein